MHFGGKSIIIANVKKWQKIEAVLVTTQKLCESPVNHCCSRGSWAEGDTLERTWFCFSVVNYVGTPLLWHSKGEQQQWPLLTLQG